MSARTLAESIARICGVPKREIDLMERLIRKEMQTEGLRQEIEQAKSAVAEGVIKPELPLELQQEIRRRNLEKEEDAVGEDEQPLWQPLWLVQAIRRRNLEKDDAAKLRILFDTLHEQPLRLVQALEKLFALPNWENRCGDWQDVNQALRKLHAAYSNLSERARKKAGA